MKVVIDTVVILRALMNPRGWWGQFAARSEHFEVVTSPELVLEAVQGAMDPELGDRLRRMSDEAPMQRLLAMLALAEIVEPETLPRVCRDPNDDKLFAAALVGHADYIVSEDKDVLAVKEYQGIRTVTAAGFLRLLDRRT